MAAGRDRGGLGTGPNGTADGAGGGGGSTAFLGKTTNVLSGLDTSGMPMVKLTFKKKRKKK